ncbi:LacI family DNA-binding transcriptional regulator [Litorivicinus lipolyticus]|uniref:LacI family DNA-binding transcriptional regulator n=1 Tax=Litorivicinus lipolyticus TaxID=418701 RepID=A0A5Q2Q7W8_9GAMM|nr:LacI family DNA-binding transcriptional regulator [Litorivicinus lipolyticus]
MASIKDVARVANVSVSTVSHVINKTRFVSDGTAQRVAAAIDQLDFQPSHVAKAASTWGCKPPASSLITFKMAPTFPRN